jgi:hypothetical protein
MYTINKASEILGVTKVTIYKHMAKNGIDKGHKLTDEEINVLSNSIAKTKKVNNIGKDILNKEKEYVYSINLLENKVKELEREISLLEKDNRELLRDLQTSQIIVNESQKQNIELINSKQKLLENKKNKWWKR